MYSRENQATRSAAASLLPKRACGALFGGTLAISTLLLAACGSSGDQRGNEMLPVDENAQPTMVTIDGVQDGRPLDPDSLAGRAPSERVIYFDYDRSELKPEFLGIVTEHGRFLAQNSDARVRLEGHTDERGTREYNIALGERRARTIQRMLQLQGVSSAQIRTVSYGEELPAVDGHTPDAWEKNRRVNIIYETTPPS
ncbi:MAG: peptidoglycan-associated lipoprotein [Gammaproteobacteria bacterium]|nr:MAG: peptidoglycan-associated lipoprotein [Gammaproteobacteria bacterium]